MLSFTFPDDMCEFVPKFGVIFLVSIIRVLYVAFIEFIFVVDRF